MKHLKALEISDLPIMTDKVLEAISNSCSNLEVLDVHKCYNITDKSAASVAMLKLKKLNFSKTLVN